MFRALLVSGCSLLFAAAAVFPLSVTADPGLQEAEPVEVVEQATEVESAEVEAAGAVETESFETAAQPVEPAQVEEATQAEGDATEANAVETQIDDPAANPESPVAGASESKPQEEESTADESAADEVAPGEDEPQFFDGVLDREDRQLPAGEYYDIYTFEMEEGRFISARVESDDFDTYIIIRSPSGETTENDDHQGEMVSLAVTDVLESGTWEVIVTSYAGEETGEYTLEINTGKSENGPGEMPFDPANARVEQGELEFGDRTLESGEYCDYYYVDAEAGQQVVVDLNAVGFDPYLIVEFPRGDEQLDNDDYAGSQTQSQISFTAPESGQYEVIVTSYAVEETGAYTLSIMQSNEGIAGAGETPDVMDDAQANDAETSEVSGDAPQQPESEVFNGVLEVGDPQLPEGEYYDIYSFEVESGRSMSARVESEDFDTYVIIRSPSGELTENDDYQGERVSLAEVGVIEAGTWEVIVTSYAGEETGDYVLEVTTGNSADAVSVEEPEVRQEEGELEPGDATLESGEYCDYFEFDGEAGERVTVDLQAEGFDPYLILEYPGGDEQEDNDDHAGSQSRSLISITLPQSGRYKVIVTSYAVDEVGSYSLTITQGAQIANANRTETGTLEHGDDQLDSGEFVDYHIFEGRRDQRVHIDLESSEFDTYLILSTPGGRSFYNDDVEEMPGHSIIDSYLPEDGTYSIGVTSYEPGETGDYVLTISVEEISSEDITGIALGDEIDASLSDEDPQLGSSYVDVYSFHAEEGQFIQVDMISPDAGEDPEIDTVLNIVAPSGETFSNDDRAEGSTNSRITMSIPESGHYRIEATSYSDGETGRYSISVRVPDAIAKGRVRGVFVGISDYDDKENYLEYCNADATRVSNALIENYGMQLNDAVILTDRIATVENVEAVLDRMAEEVGPDDTFVFFFSGHAEKQPCEHPQPADIDGSDEALMLVDGKMLDDTLNAKLNAINAGTQLIVIDACFAGGFARDIITEGDRIGFFSSEDDITSGVAEKFKAGGYLASFLTDALTDGSADGNNDGAITCMELRTALRDLFHKHRAGMDNQELVIDRGSVSADAILLFRR